MDMRHDQTDQPSHRVGRLKADGASARSAAVRARHSVANAWSVRVGTRRSRLRAEVVTATG
ncbi:hypothetical protein GCM10009727_12800 [Actinomadura napierensis]|uniref:Uncharacterized protein n=1 Tax=Actinomadura napierensis TaxID=267854 RepID=A0ABP5K021_9ACTN